MRENKTDPRMGSAVPGSDGVTNPPSCCHYLFFISELHIMSAYTYYPMFYSAFLVKYEILTIVSSFGK